MMGSGHGEEFIHRRVVVDAGEVARLAFLEEAELFGVAGDGEDERNRFHLVDTGDERGRGDGDDEIGLGGEGGVEELRELGNLALGVVALEDKIGALDEAGLVEPV